MHENQQNIYDVVIAGAGPVGLFLACELRLAGISVLCLEQSEEASSPLKRLPFGMRGLSVPTIEAFYRRGLLNDFTAAQPISKVFDSSSNSTAAHWMRQSRQPGGHFAGIQFFCDSVDTSKWQYRLPSPADSNMATDMEHLETVLAARANTLGVEIRRGYRVDGFDVSAHDVTIHAGQDIFRGRWLVGCDGGRSTVRRAGGFEFIGTDPEFTGYSVQVQLADGGKAQAWAHLHGDGYV